MITKCNSAVRYFYVVTAAGHSVGTKARHKHTSRYIGKCRRTNTLKLNSVGRVPRESVVVATDSYRTVTAVRSVR